MVAWLSPGAPASWRAFELVFRPWMRSRLRVHATGLPEEPPVSDRPLLLCANHESFWDGFLLREVQRRIRPEAPYRAVMLRSELDRRPWLGALGALGVEPGSVGSTRALLRDMRALATSRPSSVVAFFPQGRIRPGDPRPLAFRRGAAAVAAALAPAIVLPVAIRVVPGSTARMEALLSVGTPLRVDRGERPSVGTVERAVERELDAIAAFVGEHGEDAPARWPAATSRLPRAGAAYAPSRVYEPWISRN